MAKKRGTMGAVWKRYSKPQPREGADPVIAMFNETVKVATF
jgi:hypothetical protein